MTELCGHIKRELDTNPFFAHLSDKRVRDVWTKTNMVLSNGSKIKGESFGSSLRGGHYDKIIIDDPLKDYAGMKRDDQRMFFYSAIWPALNPGGQMVIDGTPIDFTDLLSDIERNDKFHTAKFPAIKADGSVLWPGRYSRERLEERRAIIGSWAFGREYLLQRQSPETAPLKVEWLKEYKALPVNRIVAIAIDPAISKEETADHTGISIGCRDENNNVYLVKLLKERLNPYELIDIIFRLYKEYNPYIIGLETVAFQKVVKYWLYDEMVRRGVSIPIEELKTQGRTKQQRIMGLQPRMEAGQLWVDPTDPATDKLKDEITKFRLELKDNDDDLLDATTMLNELLQVSPAPVKAEPYATLPERDRRVWEDLDKRIKDNLRKYNNKDEGAAW